MTNVRIQFFSTGRFHVPQRWIVPHGGLNLIDVPTLFALVDHPLRGKGLVDTGASSIFARSTHNLVLGTYRRLTRFHITSQEAAVAQLYRAQVMPTDIAWIALTHLDADHVGGLRDFPDVPIFAASSAIDCVADGSARAALDGRLFPHHLPADFLHRAVAVPEQGPAVGPLPWSHDLFGDGSVVVVPLPGHAVGHCGALVRTDAARYFLVADAVWTRRGLTDWGAFHELVAHDRAAQATTRAWIREFVADEDVVVVPSHCPWAAAELVHEES